MQTDFLFIFTVKMSKLNPLYEKGAVRYFYNLHLERMKQMDEIPVSYSCFYQRLRKGMILKEAIYTPSDTKMIRNRIDMKPKKKQPRYIRLLKRFK